MTFIDYEKALDSVHIPAILQGIWKQEGEQIYCKMFEDIYEDERATTKLHSEANKIYMIV